MKAIERKELICEALAGTHIGNCLREAAMLALEMEIPVVLIHNKHRYVVNPHKMLQSIYDSEAPR